MYAELDAALVEDDDSVTVRGDSEDGDEIAVANDKVDDSLDNVDGIAPLVTVSGDVSDGLTSALGECGPNGSYAFANNTPLTLQEPSPSDPPTALHLLVCYLQIVDRSSGKYCSESCSAILLYMPTRCLCTYSHMFCIFLFHSTLMLRLCMLPKYVFLYVDIGNEIFLYDSMAVERE